MQVTLEWTRATGSYGTYSYFIFLNSSVRGPFYPSYMPQGWQWTQAFTNRIIGDVKVVASSLVCLPDVDLGGPGPRVRHLRKAVHAGGHKSRLISACFDITTVQRV
jgi:hypothetical protein